MIDSKWFCEPDEQRETWCFLNLHENDNCNIVGWDVGYGNPTTLLCEIKNQKTKEVEIIKELLIHLYHCRKDNIILITNTSDVLPILRTRILLLNVKEVCFYGLKYICIEEIMLTYFQHVNLINESKQIWFLWSLLQKIGPLLPKGVLL